MPQWDVCAHGPNCVCAPGNSLGAAYVIWRRRTEADTLMRSAVPLWTSPDASFMSTVAKLSSRRPALGPATAAVLRSRTVRYAAGVLVVAAGYYAFAKVGQTVRYTASVSAIWPPAGFGIAALYLWGLRWWPGVFLGEVVVNGELLLDHTS
jgi:hypothetical protein